MICLTDPSIVIIIDLWAYQYPSKWKIDDELPKLTNKDLVERIITFINTNDFVEKVYGGTYDIINLGYEVHNDISLIKKPYQNLSKKWERIAKDFGSDKRVWDAYELRLKHLSKMPHIKNIYITGMGWSKCVKTRSLGYVNMRHVIPDKNIIINKNLVAGFKEEDIHQNSAEWIVIDKDHYLYYAFLDKSLKDLNKSIYHKFKKFTRQLKIEENNLFYRKLKRTI